MRAAPLDVAEAAREAGTSFLVGVRNGWGKAQLAAWLLGPYAHATSFTSTSVTSEETREIDDSWEDPESRPPPSVSDESLDELLYRARAEVVEELDAAVYGRSRPAFVENAVAIGSVTPFVWMPGVRGWAPRERARLRLRDRILALFAADYLTRPETYARELYVCPDCMCAVFDENAVARGKCPLHDRPSGIRNPPQMAPADERVLLPRASKTLDERVDELLAESAELEAFDAAAAEAEAVAPGSYRFVAGEPYTVAADPFPSEPVILLKKKVRSA